MEELKNILYSIRVEFEYVLILLHGDFNIDLLSSNNNRVRPEFISDMYSNGLLSIILKPTRVGRTSATLIDHIWINDYSKLNSSNIILTNISNHFAISGSYQICAGSNTDETYVTVTKRVVNRMNLNALKNDISNFN